MNNINPKDVEDFLNGIQKPIKQLANQSSKDCIRVKVAKVISVNGSYATVRLPESPTNGSEDLSNLLNKTNETLSVNEYVYVFYFNNNLSNAYIGLRKGVSSTTTTVQTANLLNGWLSYGFNFKQPAYFKDSQNLVHLEGSIKSGTIGTTAFILDVGFRPEYICSFAVNSNNTFGAVDILQDGSVVIKAGSNSKISLDGISFRAV